MRVALQKLFLDGENANAIYNFHPPGNSISRFPANIHLSDMEKLFQYQHQCIGTPNGDAQQQENEKNRQNPAE